MTSHPREGGRKYPFAPIDRRTFIKRTGLAAASVPLLSAFLAACPRPDEPTGPTAAPARPNSPVRLPSYDNLAIQDGLQPESGPLEIYNWEEYINPRVVGMFEEQYGVKVNVNTFNTMTEAVGTLTTSDQTYDVWIADIDVLGKLAASGLLRPLNHSYVPNLANAWDRFQGASEGQPYYDVGAQYSVPYTTYTSGVAWRIDEGGPSEEYVAGLENEWDLLWDEKWTGKIHLLDDYRESIAAALLKNGITDINTDDAAARATNLQKAQQSLIEAVERLNVKADVSGYSDLPQGESLIHHGWSGDFIASKWYFPEGTVDKDVLRYWTPSEKGPAGNDTFTILGSGKNPVLAHHFLNFMLDFDNAMVNFQWNGYIPPQKQLDPEKLVVGSGESYSILLPGLRSTVATEADIEKMTELAPLSPDVDSQWKDVWEFFQTAS